MIKENTRDCLMISVDLSAYSVNCGTIMVMRHTDSESKILNVIKNIDARNIYEELLGIKKEKKEKKTTDDIMKEDVAFLEISARIYNALHNRGINTIEKLCNKTYREIYMIRGIGESSLKELVDAMKMYGLYFKD